MLKKTSFDRVKEKILEIDFINQDNDGKLRIEGPQHFWEDIFKKSADEAISEAEENTFDPELFKRRWGGIIDGEYYCGHDGECHYQEKNEQ